MVAFREPDEGSNEVPVEVSPDAWRLLVAIAAEERLPVDAVEALSIHLGRVTNESGGEASAQGVVESLLESWEEAGLVEGVRGVRPLRLALKLGASTQVRAGIRCNPRKRQRVLREAHQEGVLRDIAVTCRAVLGERSRADVALSLQEGAFPSLSKRLSKEQRWEALRESVCEPFEAVWFERTWGEEAPRIAVEVLGWSLRSLAPVGGLYAWASRRDWVGVADAPARGRTLAEEAAFVLAQHAIAREQPALVERHAAALGAADRWAFLAAAHCLKDDLSGADQLLDQSLAFAAGQVGSAEAGGLQPVRPRSRRGGFPRCGVVAPLLALLLRRRTSEEARALAKGLVGSTAKTAAPGAAKAWRTLERYSSEPEVRSRRIDVYQLPSDVSPWELLLLGITVHAHSEAEGVRAAWSQRLVHEGIRWLARDFAWMGRQALLLARGLSEKQFESQWEPERIRLRLPRLAVRPGEVVLRDLIRRKEQWERSLEALEALSDRIDEAPVHRLRVEWFVSTVDASFSRPGLSEYDGIRGWTAGRRVDLEELSVRSGELPPEDAAVIHFARLTEAGRLELPVEAFEVLIGHPRVRSGGGSRPLSVERGECRVEAFDDRGDLCIRVEPPGAGLGVNVVVEEEKRLVVYRVTAAMQRVIDTLPRDLRVPRESQGEALAVLSKLSQTIEVRSPHFGAEACENADSTPCVRFTFHAGAWLVEIGVRPFGVGGRFFAAGAGPPLLSQVSGGRKVRAERNFDEERERVARLAAACRILANRDEEEDTRLVGESRESWVLGHEELLDLLVELRDVEEPHELEWPEGRAIRVRGTVSGATLHGSLRRAKGWYLATGGVHIDALTQLSLAELSTLPSVARGRYLRLPNGDYLEVENRVRRVMAALLTGERTGGAAGALRLHESALFSLRTLSEDDAGFVLDASVRDWLERVDEVKAKHFGPPPELRGELRPYQLEGYRWLAALGELRLGACLADDMGLGKTVQILALLVRYATEGPVLVVAPTSVCTNWVLEARRFTPVLSVREYVGAQRAAVLADLSATSGRHPLVVCSYTLLQQDAETLSEVDWSTVVLDEAQFIKNPASRRAQAAHRLRAAHRIAATGTPVENHLGDLWSIFHFLNPALLGPWKAFERRFVKPVEREEDTERGRALRGIVAPYVLRRNKSQVLSELPPLTTIQKKVQLSDEEELLYAALRRQVHDKLRTVHGKRSHKLEILAEITRLRRFCCHPSLVFPNSGSAGSKLETFLELALELAEGRHRALVFSQFVDFLALVRERLDEQGLAYEYLDGSTPKAERQSRVDAFQQGSAPLFLISLKAGGFGLNLTEADYVIHLDPWWNPAAEAQATDRAHRIGQERPVTVYRLITKDSIEERIVDLHEHKRRLSADLLEGGERAGKLSTPELLALLER